MNICNHNILFITRAPIHGGTENVILQLCETLSNRANKIVVCAGKGFRREDLDKLGIVFYEIPDIESKDIKSVFKVSSILRKVIKQENITLIHTHHRMAAFYISMLGLYKKCAFYNTSHNTFFNKKILTRFAYKHANLVACGEMVKKNLEDVFHLRNVTVVHNAVKPFSESIVPDSLIEKLHDQGNFIVGNVGRLSEQKGMEYFIQAIPEVLKKYPNASFLIVGSGEDEHSLKSLTCELGIKDKLTFMGYRTDVQNLMSQMDLVVLSSLWEGFPLTPIEAFSVGKTIIATSVDGTVEIVRNEKNGLLIEPKNPKQISMKIIWMIEHPKERKKMEANANVNYLDEFSIDTFAEGYIKCYE